MLTTSVSLPVTFASLWRVRQHEVMRLATRTLRIQFSRQPLRRGVTRMYNRAAEDFSIVTTRFTEAEYDTLHSAAAAFRVSVSWLVCCIIQMWLKPSRRKQGNPFLTNYIFAVSYTHLDVYKRQAPIRGRRSIIVFWVVSERPRCRFVCILLLKNSIPQMRNMEQHWPARENTFTIRYA